VLYDLVSVSLPITVGAEPKSLKHPHMQLVCILVSTFGESLLASHAEKCGAQKAEAFSGGSIFRLGLVMKRKDRAREESGLIAEAKHKRMRIRRAIGPFHACGTLKG
jgi:hypothetical protein